MTQTSTTRRIAVVATLAATTLAAAALVGCDSTPTTGAAPASNDVARINDAERRCNQADEYLKHDQFDKAAEIVGPVVNDQPGNWRGQFAYGRAMMAKGEFEDARRALDRAYRLQPKNEDVVTALGTCMGKQKDVKDAYQLLRAFGKDFRSWRAYMTLSFVADQASDPDTAVTAADDAIKVNEPLPGARPSIEPYVRAADLAFRFGKDAQGIRRLRQAYGINPEDNRIADMLRAHGLKVGKDTALPLGP
jgi:cytochrome c-type biogenesis protein CcmH/NrfG